MSVRRTGKMGLTTSQTRTSSLLVASGVPGAPTSVSATAKRIPGITFSKRETTHKCPHVERARGSFKPMTLSAINKVIAPNAQRPKATPNGVKNSGPT